MTAIAGDRGWLQGRPQPPSARRRKRRMPRPRPAEHCPDCGASPWSGPPRRLQLPWRLGSGPRCRVALAEFALGVAGGGANGPLGARQRREQLGWNIGELVARCVRTLRRSREL